MKNHFSRALLLAALVAFFWSPQPQNEFDTGKASFSLKVDDLVSPYRVFAYPVMPNQRVSISASAEPKARFQLKESAQSKPQEAQKWQWQAPAKPGVYPISVRKLPSNETVTLNMLVMQPASKLKNGQLNGYKIGSYPKELYKGMTGYKAPQGFIEVNAANDDLQLSPHFQLKQFICKQRGGDPKYIVLNAALLLKLEKTLETVNLHGLRTDSFTVMSGYRTPYYNKSIGNVKFSEHQWGSAADIFVDENPRDGVMDDLNHDRQFNQKDALYLARLVEDYVDPQQPGGLGSYSSTENHGPFVHLDVRGFKARW